jgi:hypothetical protein
LNFNQPFEKWGRRGSRPMQQDAIMLRQEFRQRLSARNVPLLVRFMGKLVLEVLPAALASVIGAFLFAHYQFARPAVSEPAAPATAALPASAEMVRLVREEHAMVGNFLLAQLAAEKSRAEAAAAAQARAAADAKLAAAAVRRAAAAMDAAKADARRSKPVTVTAAAVEAAVPANAASPPLTAQNVGFVPPQPVAPVHASLVSRTLAVKDDVVAATLHAVMTIGGIPSWIGHRIGANNLDEAASSAAS